MALDFMLWKLFIALPRCLQCSIGIQILNGAGLRRRGRMFRIGLRNFVAKGERMACSWRGCTKSSIFSELPNCLDIALHTAVLLELQCESLTRRTGLLPPPPWCLSPLGWSGNCESAFLAGSWGEPDVLAWGPLLRSHCRPSHCIL